MAKRRTKRKAKKVVKQRTTKRLTRKVEYPNQSERGKCELQITKDGKLYCVHKEGCRGECILYSVPQGKPKAPWRPEKQPLKPDPKRYYFCRCLEL